GWCHAEVGSAERARHYNERAAALAREVGDPEILSNAAINLAQNHLDLGDLEQAQAHLEPIERALTQPGDPWMRWRYALHARHTRAPASGSGGGPRRRRSGSPLRSVRTPAATRSRRSKRARSSCAAARCSRSTAARRRRRRSAKRSGRPSVSATSAPSGWY